MKNLKNKKGISLIVLILTIIVMIILATAIILSLSNSGIIGKASQAKTDSDNASLKEYVNVLQAEWELMSETERGDYDDSSIKYVNAKLEAEGYKQRLNDDGILLTEAAIYAIDNNIQIGDVVNYTVTEKSVKSKYFDYSYWDGTSTVHTDLPNVTDLTWIYIGINDEGELLISPDVSTNCGLPWYLWGWGASSITMGAKEMHRICNVLYSETGKGKARCMDFEDVKKLLGYSKYNGGFYDEDGNYVLTEKKMTVAELEKEHTYSTELSNTFADPYGDKGKSTSDSFANDLTILKTEKTFMEHPENIKYVFPSQDGFDYDLASPVTSVNFKSNCINYGFMSVRNSYVGGCIIWDGGASLGHGAALRPVVALQAKITPTTASDGSTVWNF